ncbi:MAG: DUF1385 domain-containing protein [Anaerolineales bacterium]|nr:DUF1385 domain-containing protein [Anaerolineales bacterium]MCB0019469.1 DUF1385 domain-containing protein [Anaerolineales bacterium]
MSSTPKQFNYGGQAVIEGVMMRGSRGLSVAVRNPRDEIVIHTEPLNARIYGGGLGKIPFLRGVILLWDALGLGTKALMFSADVAIEEDEVAPNADPAKEGKKDPSEIFAKPAQIATVVVSLALSIGLFFLLPAFLADLLTRLAGSVGLLNTDLATGNTAAISLFTNLVEGFVRLFLVVGYIWAIGLMPDIKRLYGYHGAEHKTINAFESGAELTPESVARFPLEHPRCGTAFLLTVVLVSILFFSVLTILMPALNHWALRLLSRLLFLPVVAGIAYEFIRFTAKYQHWRLIRWLTAPNLALQRLTTREPDRSMLEVAIAAFNEVLALEYETALAEKVLPLDESAPAPEIS